MDQMLQAHDRHRLRAVPGQRAVDNAGTESDVPLTTLDREAMAHGDAANVVPLFGVRGGALTALHPAAVGPRSALALRGWLVQSLLLEAIMRDELGEVPAAEQALERALELAEHDRVVLPFTVAPVLTLLERHTTRCRSTHRGLIAEIFRVLDRHSPVASPSGSGALLEPLTEGEARVLRYLPTNLSKREIAQELYVSVHTIKTHMRHIYNKLDAHNRRDTVRRAREYGLLGHASTDRSCAS
ncbi:MAG: LuxR C-terminal-related transcriptional regulator [Solirubrobacteraceae bacterium]